MFDSFQVSFLVNILFLSEQFLRMADDGRYIFPFIIEKGTAEQPGRIAYANNDFEGWGVFIT